MWCYFANNQSLTLLHKDALVFGRSLTHNPWHLAATALQSDMNGLLQIPGRPFIHDLLWQLPGRIGDLSKLVVCNALDRFDSFGLCCLMEK
jgi:hypothetical protein